MNRRRLSLLALVIFVAVADGIIEIKFPVIALGDFRRPEMRAEFHGRADHGVAGELPLDKIRGLEQGKDFAKCLAVRLEFAGADGVVSAPRLPNKRIGEVAAVHRICVNNLLGDQSHIKMFP